MRAIIILSLGLLMTSVTSCGKYYNCECTTTTVVTAGGTTTSSFKGTSSAIGRRMSKSDAGAVCAHEQQAIQSNVYNGATNNGDPTYTSGTSVTTECVVK